VQLNGRAVPVEGDLFTVVFGEDGRLSGLGACNRFMGSYQTTETGGLTVGQNMASTRMFCPDLDREQAFGDVLSGATHYEVDGDMLMLLTDGELRAVLQAR
jgi:heat shock protein HslJ